MNNIKQSPLRTYNYFLVKELIFPVNSINVSVSGVEIIYDFGTAWNNPADQSIPFEIPWLQYFIKGMIAGMRVSYAREAYLDHVGGELWLWSVDDAGADIEHIGGAIVASPPSAMTGIMATANFSGEQVTGKKAHGIRAEFRASGTGDMTIIMRNPAHLIIESSYQQYTNEYGVQVKIPGEYF